jgi:hypothetical protein
MRPCGPWRRKCWARSGGDPARIETLFADQSGYATPKVDVRGAVFDRDGRILLVREVADAGRWTRAPVTKAA